jgi:CheY-like chemotaxis protein
VPLHILLADDSVPAQNMGKKILCDAGFAVTTASNGLEAIRKIADAVPDVAILDIFMPGYTGLEVCQKLRASAATAHLPVILTVGKLEPYRPEDGAQVQSNAVIVKPFVASELIAAVRSVAQAEAAAPATSPAPAAAPAPSHEAAAADADEPLFSYGAPATGAEDLLSAGSPVVGEPTLGNATEGSASLLYNPDAGHTRFSASAADLLPSASAADSRSVEVDSPFADLEIEPDERFAPAAPDRPEAPLLSEEIFPTDPASEPAPPPLEVPTLDPLLETSAPIMPTGILGESNIQAGDPEPQVFHTEAPAPVEALTPEEEARRKAFEELFNSSELPPLEETPASSLATQVAPEPPAPEAPAPEPHGTEPVAPPVSAVGAPPVAPEPILQQEFTMTPAPAEEYSEQLPSWNVSAEEEPLAVDLEPHLLAPEAVAPAPVESHPVELHGESIKDVPIQPPVREEKPVIEPAAIHAEEVKEKVLPRPAEPAEAAISQAPLLEMEQPEVPEEAILETAQPLEVEWPTPVAAEPPAVHPEEHFAAPHSPVAEAPEPESLAHQSVLSSMTEAAAGAGIAATSSTVVQRVETEVKHVASTHLFAGPETRAEKVAAPTAEPAPQTKPVVEPDLSAKELAAPVEVAAVPVTEAHAGVRFAAAEAPSAPVGVALPHVQEIPAAAVPHSPEVASETAAHDSDAVLSADSAPRSLEAERMHQAVERVIDRFKPLLVAAIVRELARME